MSLCRSSGARDADSSPKCLRSRATIQTLTCSTSARFTSRRENTHERDGAVFPKNAFRLGVRPGAPFARRPRRRSGTEPRFAGKPCSASWPRKQSPAHRFCIGSWNRTRAGADIFLGMNPIKAHCYSRAKENVREIRHVYLDLDEEAAHSLEAIRSSGDVPTPEFCTRYFSRKKSSRLASRGTRSRTSRGRCCARWQRSSGATSPQPTYPACFACPDLQTESTTSNFWSALSRRRTRSTIFTTSRVYEDSPDAPRHLGDEPRPHAPAAIRAPESIRSGLGVREARTRAR